jgi:hypothetical protein
MLERLGIRAKPNVVARKAELNPSGYHASSGCGRGFEFTEPVY